MADSGQSWERFKRLIRGPSLPEPGKGRPRVPLKKAPKRDDDELPPEVYEEHKLRAVSYSRDSAGKEERLRQWRERQQESFQDREHKRNEWTASAQELAVVAHVDSFESAAGVGERGEAILRAAEANGADVVIVPSLRRLGVGLAQVLLVKLLEDAGLKVVSGNTRENELLAQDPDASRDIALWEIAGHDEYEWTKAKERLAKGRESTRGTGEWEAALDFIAERPHLTLQALADILTARGYKTVSGGTGWRRCQVLRARQEIANSRGFIKRETTRNRRRLLVAPPR